MKKNIQPKTKDELRKLINDEVAQYGLECDLNHIDVSLITDMSSLFNNSPFIGNISKWNMSNVTNTTGMFAHADFNGDISQWDVSHVQLANMMFFKSNFNSNIGQWNILSLEQMPHMFCGSPFNQDISNWNVSNVKDMNSLFMNSSFSHDLSHWTPYCATFLNLLKNSPAPIPYWYEISDQEERIKAMETYQFHHQMNQSLDLHQHVAKVKL